MKQTPQWVRDALDSSGGPRWIREALKASDDLADLWEQMPEAWRTRLSGLPEHLGMVKPSQTRHVMPWTAQHTPAEQKAAAEHIAELARELNDELRRFQPFAPMRLHQFVKADDTELHQAFAGIPIAARADSLLLRVERMALDYKPTRSALVQKPMREGAYQTYLIRAVDRVARRAKWGSTSLRHAFVAGVVNALDPRTHCDTDAVKESLRATTGVKCRK
jgi:hypothetical protein